MSEDRCLRKICDHCDATFPAVIFDPKQLSDAHKGMEKFNLQNCIFCGHPNLITMGSLEDLKKNEPPQQAPRDLRFHEAKPYSHDDTNLICDIHTGELLPVATAFIANLRRLKRMLEMPTEVHILSMIHSSMHLQNVAAKKGKRHDPSEVNEEFRRIIAETEEPVMERARIAAGNQSFDTMMSLSGNRLWHGLESVLAAQITGAWTAFEVMAGDLWITAVNAMPDPLALLQGREDRIEDIVGKDPKPENEMPLEIDEDFIAIKSTKTIGLHHLHRMTNGTFNISRKMGHIFAVSERVKFSSLMGIRKAYSLAFVENLKGLKPTSIDNALADKSLNALAIVRNMIVHSAGIADDQYEEDCKGKLNAPKLKIGQHLKLTGGDITSLVSPVVECSVKLMKAVDKWMNNYKMRRPKK